MGGSWYCLEGCLERALAEAIRRTPSAVRKTAGAHRIPLGLQLLSRDQLTAEQLRTALAAQRSAGCGRIGEWLQALGFVTEQQITAALARQWACPVLQSENLPPQLDSTFEIPVALLEAFAMVPVNYVAATRTLFIAFSDGIDYGVLFDRTDARMPYRALPGRSQPAAPKPAGVHRTSHRERPCV